MEEVTWARSRIGEPAESGCEPGREGCGRVQGRGACGKIGSVGSEVMEQSPSRDPRRNSTCQLSSPGADRGQMRERLHLAAQAHVCSSVSLSVTSPCAVKLRPAHRREGLGLAKSRKHIHEITYDFVMRLFVKFSY